MKFREISHKFFKMMQNFTEILYSEICIQLTEN
jgi:hypothetical protein